MGKHSYVEFKCQCGAELKGEQDVSGTFGYMNNVTCPDSRCGKLHRMPGIVVQLWKKERGEWVEVSL